eukprot:5352172-Pleurochrysis_carterae.AAC.1
MRGPPRPPLLQVRCPPLPRPPPGLRPALPPPAAQPPPPPPATRRRLLRPASAPRPPVTRAAPAPSPVPGSGAVRREGVPPARARPGLRAKARSAWGAAVAPTAPPAPGPLLPPLSVPMSAAALSWPGPGEPLGRARRPRTAPQRRPATRLPAGRAWPRGR